MRNLFIFLILLSAPLIAIAKPLAIVNGHSITLDQLMVADPAAAHNSQQQENILNTLISRELLAQVAEKNGWDNNPKLTDSLKVQRTQMLATIAAEKYWSEHPIKQSEIHAAYQDMVSTYPDKEFRYREIIVSDRAKADQLLQQLKSGKSFSMLANQYSQASNAQIGGETGWVANTAVPAAFLPILKTSQNLEITGPVNVPSGWAIIQKLGEKATSIPSLKDLSGAIETKLRNAELQKYLEALKKKATIVIPEKPSQGKDKNEH